MKSLLTFLNSELLEWKHDLASLNWYTVIPLMLIMLSIIIVIYKNENRTDRDSKKAGDKQ